MKFYNFLILFGLVSLFADLCYEGYRSIIGPYMAYLGASSFMIGFISGLGEFLSYSLRILSGYLADKTKNHWIMIYIGYLTIISVPLMGFVDSLYFLSVLIILERMGKAFRTPSKDYILSKVSSKVGIGKGFGIYELIDQIGAVLGPFIVFTIFSITHSFQLSLKLIIFPFILCIVILIYVYLKYRKLEKAGEFRQDYEKTLENITSKKDKKDIVMFFIASGLIAFSYLDFAIIAYHFKIKSILSVELIPLIYSFCMLIDGISALYFGYLFDRKGLRALFYGVLISSIFPLFVFNSSVSIAIIGLIFWAMGIGIQESILKSSLVKIAYNSSQIFGVFHFVFGISWFLGSSLAGYLYNYNLLYLIIFCLALQIISCLIIYFLLKGYNS